MAVGIIFRLQHLCDAFQYRLAGNPVVDVSGNDSDSRVSALSDSEGRRTHQPYAVVRLGSDGSGAVPVFYFAANAHAIIKLATRVTKNPVMVLMAILAMLSLMELCRRCVGIPILCVVDALLVYTFATVRFGKVIYDLFYTTSGVMNTPINVCAKYIVVFIIFGAFLERTGISNFFIDLANCLCGSSAGGPAKVAVISSALCGMVSGSSVGNTVTTGSVTIPMMKKMWLPPGICRSSGGGCFDRRADHAANHGRGSIPDGRIYGRAVCDGGAESDSSGSAVILRVI